MFKNHVYLMGMLAVSCVTVCADQDIQLNIHNDNDQSLDIGAKTPHGDFSVRQVVPPCADAIIIAKVIRFDTIENMLFDGIFQDSAVKVQQAITAGVNVYKPREGKTPLAWALALNRFNAVACLMKNGAMR